MEFIAKPKEWGNSLGIILPKKLTAQEHIKAGQEIVVEIRVKNILQETFGAFKFKKTVREMMTEINKELYND